jgi:hypothetical protein
LFVVGGEDYVPSRYEKSGRVEVWMLICRYYWLWPLLEA